MSPLIPSLVAIALLAAMARFIFRAQSKKKNKQKSPPVTDTVNIYRSILGNPAGTTPSAPTPTSSTEDPTLIAQLRQNLRTKFLYQEDKIDHAIQNERDRNPTASLADLMQAAIARYERENQ